jgi:hypothetical protein
MRKLIIFGIIVSIFLLSFVNAIYTPPNYTNVTIVLKSSYTPPNYTNVTIVLGEEIITDCWSETNNVLYIPNGCVYEINNGVIG